MEDRDIFKSQLKSCLEEETKDIYFSAEAREKVRRRILNVPVDINSGYGFSKGWLNRSISLPLKAVSLCMIVLLMGTVLYTKTFFYVSKKEIANYENREKLVLRDESVPFGAVQHLTAVLVKGKGVVRP